MTSRELNKANKLAERYTAAELGPMCQQATRKEAEILAWAVYVRTSQDRAERGDPVNMEGYSGRQTNRRR